VDHSPSAHSKIPWEIISFEINAGRRASQEISIRTTKKQARMLWINPSSTSWRMGSYMLGNQPACGAGINGGHLMLSFDLEKRVKVLRDSL